MQQAARVSQRTAFFHLGVLVEEGPTDEIFTTPKGPAHDGLRNRPLRLIRQEPGDNGMQEHMLSSFDAQLNAIAGDLAEMGHMARKADRRTLSTR